MKASRLIPLSLAVSLAVPSLGWAQQPQPAKPSPVALPEPVTPGTPIPPPIIESQTVPKEPATPVPVVAKDEAPVAVPVLPKKSSVAAKDGIVLNFQGASLTDVLNYLSEAAGFVIVQEVPVTGTVNIVSRQAISPEEAVDLVNTVLIEKGFIAIRNGRILKIVNRRDAQKRDLPVQMGSDPELIPRRDEIVTQILPLRYGEAAKLVENLRPLLAETATISANEGSNSILMTDTQANIRRIATIIKAIDTSVANISTIQVFPLKYADAKELATVITQLFSNSSVSAQGRGRGGRGGGGGGFGFPFGGAPGGGDQGGGGGGQSEAKQAASKVVAVADEQSNSLIVCAPEDSLPDIAEIIEKIDTTITDVTETKIFRLEHADAVELATIITTLYSDPTATQQNNQNRNRGQGGGRGGFNPFGGGQQAPAGAAQSERALLQSKVVAVGDPRTNSLLVTAARDSMMQIAETVGRLDATDAKRQRVFVHSLEHADADSVANVLRGMLGDQTAVNNTRNGTSRLTERSASGATMDTAEFSNTGGGGGGGGGGGARGGR